VLSIAKRVPEFWLFQSCGWLAYGIILLLSTIPFTNDITTIAFRSTLFVCCFFASFVLHLVCRRQWRRGFKLPGSLLLVLAWCSTLALVCAVVAVMAEYAFGFGLPPFHVAMTFTGATTAGFVLLSWSALYFGIKYYLAIEAERRRVIGAERSARESELRALRYQVHPHFLFNTLNAISTLVVEGENDAATSMISRLADFFRATLEGSIANEVSLEDELFLTSQYLEIEKLRLGERLRVEINVDPDLLGCLVPHLVLQPLVENSVRHGIAPRRGAGTVSIVASMNEHDVVTIKIVDDGLGKPTRLEAQNAGHGIGLANIDKRLAELYGSLACLELIWPSSGGCEAIIKIPYHEGSLLADHG
jgi:two-component system LytT family sensor kinase